MSKYKYCGIYGLKYFQNSFQIIPANIFKIPSKILESFSTRKRSEKETSLAHSYQIVTGKHGGQFLMQSEPGMGTEFEILLPLV